MTAFFRRNSGAIVGATLVAVLGAADLTFAVGYPITDGNVLVNYGSFATWLGGTDPTRAIDVALHSWPEYAGSHDRYRVGGGTSLTDCTGSNPPLIVAKPICNPSICVNPGGCGCLAGTNYDCPGAAGFLITLDTTAPGTLTGAPFADDVQSILTHEIGHSLVSNVGCDNGGHICTGDRSVMRSGYLPTLQWRRRYPNGADMDAMDATTGHVTGELYISRNASLSIPLGLWSPPTSLGASVPFHWTFGALWRGVVAPNYVRSSAMYSDSATAPYLMDYEPAGGPFPGPSYSDFHTRRRMTTVFDPNTKRWWLFLLTTFEDDSNVQVFTSPDRVNWTWTGTLADSGSHLVTTRVPVAAAYDMITGQILVLVTHWDKSNYAEFQGNPCSLPDRPYGCQDELLLFALQPNASTAWNSFVTRFAGYTAFGSPALVCDDERTSEGYQCEAFVTGTDAARSIWGFKFGVYPSKGWTGPSWSYTMSGYTNSAMAAHTVAGAPLLLAVIGTDDLVYVATKPTIGSNWTSWRTLSKSTGGALTSRHGVSLMASTSGASGWDILVNP